MEKMRIPQKPQMPQKPRPIVIIGAGGIVRDAHLPAYRKAAFPLASICDLQIEKAQSLAAEYGIGSVSSDWKKAIANAPEGAVFDLAIPPYSMLELLEAIPDGSPVLLQKPPGATLPEAVKLCRLCTRKGLLAAVNFQLRWAPFVNVARYLMGHSIGDVHDIEVRIVANTPWHLWEFMYDVPRLEILYHSIHYIDLIRSFWGDPVQVYAKTLRSTRTERLASTRSVIVLDYGDVRRATITTNHEHNYGARHQESYVKWEGPKGAVKAQMGLMIDYPRGVPDWLEFCSLDDEESPQWRSVELEGAWFPDAFIGPIADLMCVAEGSKTSLAIPIEDACTTMAVVEAAYESSESGGTRIPGGCEGSSGA